MNKSNPTDKQLELARSLNLQDGKTKPKEYENAHRQMTGVPTAPKPKLADIPNTVAGYYPQREVVPLNGFNALEDLPSGWALVSCCDSGNNHTLVNAGEHILRRDWCYY